MGKSRRNWELARGRGALLVNPKALGSLQKGGLLGEHLPLGSQPYTIAAVVTKQETVRDIQGALEQERLFSSLLARKEKKFSWEFGP